jgi:MoaA/NifB/PqqE/SkfB family radical SAM enzyme
MSNIFYIIVLLASSMELEITKELKDLAKKGKLDNSVAILNMPAANECEKRKQLIMAPSGELVPACGICVTQLILDKNRISPNQIRQVIDYFAQNHETKFITIPGEGNPLHPKVKQETLDKIRYASSKGIQAYTFNAGNGLDEKTCQILADNKTNVMMSLRGNPFIDADFFRGKQYPSSTGKLQNQARIAEMFRRLIKTYQDNSNQPEQGTTRLGMNYTVTEIDLRDNGRKLTDLRKAAEDNGIFVVANTEFDLYSNPQTNQETKKRLGALTFGHSTSVNGVCQMGAGWSITISPEGYILRCPYLGKEMSRGNLFTKSKELDYNLIERVLGEFKTERKYACVLRQTDIMPSKK